MPLLAEKFTLFKLSGNDKAGKHNASMISGGDYSELPVAPAADQNHIVLTSTATAIK